MNLIKRILPVFLLLFFCSEVKSQNLKINELMSSNRNVVYDEDGETPDWIEILNTGNTTVNLADYYLSESKSNLLKWQFPEFILEPGKPFLVYASGKDKKQVPIRWNTIIDMGYTWKYLVPTSEPAATWKTSGFNDTSWKSGPSGFGFGDNDDNTILPNGTVSVFIRTTFNLADVDKIGALWLHMDYDDGFVAYLNGTEIARAGLGAPGTPVTYKTSPYSHEATIYQRLEPEAFDLSDKINLLKPAGNVLAIQIHNSGAGSSDMSGTPFLTVGYVSNNSTPLASSQYFKMPVLYPHTSFKLSSTGETVSITNKNGSVSDSISYGVIPAGFSYGRNINELSKWGYFYEPTPGNLNTTTLVTEVVKSNIVFSINEMFLSSPKRLSFSGIAEGETIRFTLDASDPDENSPEFRGPIDINKNMVVRARAFKPGAAPGKIASRTYIFDAKPTLPVVAITTDSMNLWDNETGIYVLGDSYENSNPYFGANFWEDWEKPAGIEMTGKDGNRIFSLNCGIKIFGAWSRARPQKSLAVFFRNEYGDPSLEGVQLFNSKPITSFKSIVLRNAGNDYDYTRFRDGFMTDLVKDMDTDIQAFEPVVLYLNGKYWGHINLREKINEDYLDANHSVDPAMVDILENNAVVVEGSNEDYIELVDFLNSHSLVSDANYEVVAGQVDISNYIDYMLSQIYFDNRDWPGNNIKFWKEQREGSKWRWLMYDTDFGFGIYNGSAYTLNTIQFALEPNNTDWPNPAWSTLLFRKLTENTKFKNAFINRFADMMNTTFKADRVVAKIDSIANIMQPEIYRHYQRWGVPSEGGWNAAIQTMRTFGNNRAANVRNHITQQFTRAGIFDVNTVISPVDAGSIYLNTINIQAENWTGKYFQNVPVKLTAVPKQGYKFRHWEISGTKNINSTIEISLTKVTTFKAVFEETVNDGNSVVINEINYKSADNADAGDWIELFNWGRADLDISGWVMKDSENDHIFRIPGNTVLKSNEYLVVCASSTNFSTIHPTVLNKTGDFNFGLGATGDAVRLFTMNGILVDSVAFGSTAPWATEPNGTGKTLELRHYTFDNSVADNWKASVAEFGTPGRANSIYVGNETELLVKDEKQLLVYPNPFSAETTIRFANPYFDQARISIYSVDGSLISSVTTTGNEIIWNGQNQNGQRVQPGIYICRVISGSKEYSAKIMLRN